jgi:hypothetical protein
MRVVSCCLRLRYQRYQTFRKGAMLWAFNDVIGLRLHFGYGPLVTGFVCFFQRTWFLIEMPFICWDIEEHNLLQAVRISCRMLSLLGILLSTGSQSSQLKTAWQELRFRLCRMKIVTISLLL